MDGLERRVTALALLGLAACTASSESTDTGGLVTTTGQTMTTEVTATTLPLTTASTTTDTSGEDTNPVTATSPDSSTSGSDSGGTDDSGSSGPGDSSTTDPDPGDSSSGDSSGTVYDIEWCRLQYPPDVMVSVDEPFTVYVRLYVPGLTDLSTGNDPAPELVVEMGYGLDGSDPSMGVGAPWDYVPAMPNAGWDDAVEPNNDEYQGDLSIDAAGIYDYAARISGNGGADWVYCDLDDLLTGGYTPDQAGHAEVDP